MEKTFYSLIRRAQNKQISEKEEDYLLHNFLLVKKTDKIQNSSSNRKNFLNLSFD